MEPAPVLGVSADAAEGEHGNVKPANGKDRVFIQSDVTNNPHLFVNNPGWHVQFDMDGPAAEATRRKVYDMLSADKMMIAGFHFPFPATGYIEKDGNNYRLFPKNWNTTL